RLPVCVPIGCAVRVLVFHSGFFDSAQQTAARPNGGKHMEKSRGRTSICISQKSDFGDNHPGFVRGPAGRRDGINADFRRSNSALRTCWPWLAASNACDRRLCNGAGGSAFAADEADWTNLALVC